MGYELRELTVEDLPAAWELSRLAFGYREREAPPASLTVRPGRRAWGAFDASGRLVAKALDRHQEQWFGGRRVPTSGVGGVVVVPELRGSGLGREVLTRLLAEARGRGAAVSTLFPTTPGPYRRLGWEQVGSLTWTSVPTAGLSVRRDDAAGVTLRPATTDDVPAVLAAYREVARAGTGMMERSEPLYDTSPSAVLGAHDGLSVAVGADGDVEGFASWDRGPGYDASGRLSVPDLVGLTAGATAGLLAMLASWASVAPTLLLRLPDPDPAVLLATVAGARAESVEHWMLRVVDAPAAVTARGFPPHLDGAVDLLLRDDGCPWNAGTHRLELCAGTGRLTPGGAGTVTLSPRGLAVLYASAGGPALLRRAGMLHGGDAGTDAFLAAAFAGPAPALLDYF